MDLRSYSTIDTGDIQRALVLDDGRLVGLLSITDIARALQFGGARRR